MAERVIGLGQELRGHQLWGCLTSLDAVRVFMQHHVWAVWDFMSLLKSVQADLAPVRVPWIPGLDAASARLINEIVVGEEGDDDPQGGYASHFEIYLGAMEEAGADTAPIRGFVRALGQGIPWQAALEQAIVPPVARAFVRSTLEVCAAPLPERVAAFTLGREEIIPAMFSGVLSSLPLGVRLDRFVWYLERHVTLDGDRHGPLATQLFERVCLLDRAVSEVSLGASIQTLERRIALWNAVVQAIGRGSGSD